MKWGRPGTDPGEFNLPHNITCDDGGWVYVADRENHRVQVFDGNGRYETQWNNMHRPERPVHAAAANARSAISARSAPISASTAARPTSGRASPSSTTRAS